MATGFDEDAAALKQTLDWMNATRRQLLDIAIELDARWRAETDPATRNLMWNARSFPEAELTRIKRAILDLVEGELTVEPPDPSTIEETERLSDELQEVRLKEKTVEAIVALASDIGRLVSGVLASRT